ncbi:MULTISPECIES: hypothetical protein [Arenibacter]|uniref:hypothetical protein n=1 Tax=Arenibacter TaxID=178469 RepID=UPI001C0781EA|nr:MULTISPECIES: hypothetical protein [Arenibacter]MBU2906203.1 hypothetical protein [Arenibacter algicola]MCK0135074.1 hypothetical protein [Arenibacter sp. S6351L]
MKKMNFYPKTWQVVPLLSDRYLLDSDGKCIKDLVLRNSYATDMKVSEMDLNITKFSAIDTHGQEHFIGDFPGQASIPIKGMHTGLFLKSKSVLSLEKGSYSAFRFYLGKSGSKIIYSDRFQERADGIKFLDFEIVNGLTIEGEESPEAILRFDFVPFKTMGLLKSIAQFFKGPAALVGKLAHS